MGEPTDTQEVSASMEDASARNCGEFLEEGASKGGNQPKVDEYTKYIDDELLVGFVHLYFSIQHSKVS